MEKKVFDQKSFSGRELVDYWNLKEHPLYISLESKTLSPYFKIDEEPFLDSDAIYSITGFVRYYRQFEWLMKSKNKTKEVLDYTQSMISIPWTQL